MVNMGMVQGKLKIVTCCYLNILFVFFENNMAYVEYPVEMENMLAERVKEWTKEWKEEGLQAGLQQGMQQGMQKGVQKGTAQVLLRHLNKKFGPLSQEIEEKLALASNEQLLQWSEQILTAESLGEVFGH
jgi:hypothetical protein